MRRRSITLAILFCFTFELAAQSPDDGPYPRILVKLRTGTPLLSEARAALPESVAEPALLSEPKYSQLARALSGTGIISVRAVKPGAGSEPLAGGLERLFIAEMNPSTDIATAIQPLRARPDFEYVEPDYQARAAGLQLGIAPASGRGGGQAAPINPNDPVFSLQWSLVNTGQSINGVAGKPGSDINAPAAWSITTGSSSVILAVLDSGIALNSEEFSGRLVPGWNFVNPAKKEDVADDSGHGTAVSALAAANANNGRAIAGLDWRCKIMPVKVIDQSGSANYSNIISGIRFAVDNGARVLNLSLAGTESSAAMADAVSYARARGAIIVSALGNENTGVAHYPAALPTVIAVGATNSSDRRAVPFSCGLPGSNYESHIDFVAPGDFLATITTVDSSQVTLWCGTSVAAPLVSATITLMLAVNPSLSFDQVFSILQAGARDQVGDPAEDAPGWDKYYGWGRIDAFRSVQGAKGTSLFTHLAIGGGFSTAFTFVNTGGGAVNADLILTDKNGNPLDAALSGTEAGSEAPGAGDLQSASTKSFQVPPGGVAFLKADPPNAGFSSSGWARTEVSGGLLSGVATFQLYSGTKLTTIAGVLASQPVESATIPIDDDIPAGRYTGYAIANPSTTDTVVISVQTVNADGSTTPPAATLSPVSLKPREQTASFVFQDAKASKTIFRGSVVLTGLGGAKFSVVALVQNQELYTAIPVIPSKAPNIK